ncbi:guanine nucleotide binding protein, alpha subunit [Serendipita vermifera]|nr:guanine nucleotide binding protein, alpha subunit [Serendipita vermifera]
MGLCVSTAATDARKLNLDAENEMKKAKKQMQKEAKILLLGSGDSGKTTIMKQMRLITNASFTRGELESFRQLVFTNLVTGMKAVIECLSEVGLDITSDPEASRAYQMIEIAPDIKDGEAFPEEYLHAFQLLWQHPIVRQGFDQTRQFAIPDNVPYFFSALDRLFSPDYRPTNQDLVHTRARTSGIVETIFKVSDISGNLPDPNAVPRTIGSRRTRADPPTARNTHESTGSGEATAVEENEADNRTKNNSFKVRSAGMRDLRFVDVGGQRSERRKWIHCFQDVTAVLFLVSLSGYDQCLVEERSMNQMSDAMTIWESICTMEWFKATSLILFLNKTDLFESKIPSSPIKRFFPDYDGKSDDVEAGKQYFKRRFMRIAQKGTNQHAQQEQNAKNPQVMMRQVYPHYTCAVNTALVSTVMNYVADTVLRDHLQSADLL